MKLKRFSEEQIIRILNEAEKGDKSLQELCRQHGVTEQTLYRWRRKYAGMNVPEVQQYRSMQLENNRLRKLLVERDLEIEAMKELLKTKL